MAGPSESGIPGRVSPRIVYSRHYNIGFFGLERLHPFDSRKYGRAWRLLRRRFGRQLRSLYSAVAITATTIANSLINILLRTAAGLGNEDSSRLDDDPEL